MTKSTASTQRTGKQNGATGQQPIRRQQGRREDSTTSMSTDTDTNKSEEIIVIHVSDEKKNMKKNYQCKKGLLLKEMKYFENHLTMSDSAEDIDISV